GLFHMTSAFGVMGRYVDDLRVLGKLISGADQKDPNTVDVPFAPGKPLQDLRIAVSGRSSVAQVTPAIQSVLDAVARRLNNVVSAVEDARPPLLEEACDVLWRVFIT
ncbi:amidase family protein, partial [Pseudomonas viridiflava]|uniref:amidase family protein n=1 Tax=Pseudomonas viridiflava TaxID=33069 RepID=UPI001F11C08C